jgi:hypothetical protein
MKKTIHKEQPTAVKVERPALVSIPAKTAIELRDYFGKQSSSNRFSVEAYEVLRDALNNHGYHEE